MTIGENIRRTSMTDNEIINALECCCSPKVNACDDCPFHKRCYENNEWLEKEAIDLINRQKAEIERLETNCLSMAQTMPNMAKAERAEAVKEFAERLKEKLACLEYAIQTNRKTLPIERVKAEVNAVLQNGCSNVVDKTLKEMVGEG